MTRKEIKNKMIKILSEEEKCSLKEAEEILKFICVDKEHLEYTIDSFMSCSEEELEKLFLESYRSGMV